MIWIPKENMWIESLLIQNNSVNLNISNERAYNGLHGVAMSNKGNLTVPSSSRNDGSHVDKPFPIRRIGDSNVRAIRTPAQSSEESVTWRIYERFRDTSFQLP
jgi:hypothetical protein